MKFILGIRDQHILESVTFSKQNQKMCLLLYSICRSHVWHLSWNTC